MSKKFLIFLLFLFLLKVDNVFAGIANSPHDIVLWFNPDPTETTFIKSGVCSFCHVPHSARGDRLFPDAQAAEKTKYGTVAALCAKCHETNTYLNRTSPVVLNQIFRTLDTTKSDTTMDSHPVKGTKQATQQWTLQNTNLDSAIVLDWPWTATWSGGAKGTEDIQCSTCHDPHDWSNLAYGTTYVVSGGKIITGAKRKFLRAPVYNEFAPAGVPKNFCSYCHQNRENSKNNNTTGTHPVSAGSDYGSDRAEFSDWGYSTSGVNTGGLYKDTAYMFRAFADSAAIVNNISSREGLAIWDDTGRVGKFIGARLYKNDQIICQSCHMPHGVMHSDDDNYGPSSWNGSDTAELRVGPLLVINNASNFGRTGPTGSPLITDYPAQAETAYIIPTSDPSKEENLLCEWCHGMTPDMANDRTDTSAFSHPVNCYPTGASLGTSDNEPSDSSEYGMLHLKYPIRSWLKYRESGGIRLAGNDQKIPAAVPNPDLSGSLRGTGNYLVCLSCHEPHQALKSSPILKFGSETSEAGRAGDTTFCDGCHYDTAVGTGLDLLYFSDWTTHPSGVAATLRTSDAEDANNDTLRLPNRAGLRTFQTGNAEYISCWTCHKAHKGVEKPMLADYQWPFSQICVNCHTDGDTDTARVSSGSKDAKWSYATTNTQPNATNANPSLYYAEGVYGVQNMSGRWWNRNTSGVPAPFNIGDTTRLGSHYIGQYTGGTIYPRPVITSAANRGWLGERDTTRTSVSGSVKMTELDHRPGTPLSGDEELRDKWLMQPMADGTIDSNMVFETMTWYGSGQKSHIGTTDVDYPNRKSIICQTCHAVHNTAVGVADNANVSRLLLAPNLDSYMCKRCHIPEADTTITHPMSADTSGSVYNTASLSTGQENFSYNTLVSRTGTGVDMFSGKYAYAYDTMKAPANYPNPPNGNASADPATRRMNCDACHSAHNADSKMGAMILEGDSTAVPTPWSGLWNKVPRVPERGDRKTCDLCHNQGK